jgi:DNA repair protein RecN (Recombination protein N)
MLMQLSIQNFAIVKKLDIEWRNGMTTITGETGAGKSIAIDALGLCLGDRITTQVVRSNADKANIIATFDISHNPLAKRWLEQHDLIDQDECILRRLITAEGRSSAYINGCKVPLAQLRELSPLLINIHGQHDHQLLVKPQHQLRLLDEYAGHDNLLDTVRYHYQQWHKYQHEYQQLLQSEQQRQAQQQLLQYQVQELDEFNLLADEFTELEQDYQRQSHIQQLLQDSQRIRYELAENEPFNVIDTLNHHIDTLTELTQYDHRLQNIVNLISEALIQLEEANSELYQYSDQLDADPEQFTLIEERYSTALQLAKKHQIQPEMLYQHHMGLKQQLSLLTNDSEKLTQLLEQIEQSEQQFKESAQQLTQSRQQAAIELSHKITQNMKELNMANGRFEVSITALEPNKFSAKGLDHIEFMVSMNPGQPLEPMHKVASGGELSRIGLAIQVILSEKVITPTLIFDEVDVGISGPTAAMVGKKLKQLGLNTQVICVTHLPQVASKGHQQYFVSKLTDGKQTETTITELNEDGRVREIARLLAGDKITETSLANAQELLAG